jgi:hypothetical protein
MASTFEPLGDVYSPNCQAMKKPVKRQIAWKEPSLAEGRGENHHHQNINILVWRQLFYKKSARALTVW